MAITEEKTDLAALKQTKAELRQQMLNKRAAMEGGARKQASQAMLAALTSLPEYLAAQTIFVYVSHSHEPDTLAIIEDAWRRGKRVCVPRCVSKGIMNAHVIHNMGELQSGMYGILEPAAGCPQIGQNEIGLDIVPCVCCSKDGYRLGYGGGFYDRWLARSSAPSAVLCFASLLLDAVPLEPHDAQADILISDAEVVRCKIQLALQHGDGAQDEATHDGSTHDAARDEAIISRNSSDKNKVDDE